MNIMLFRSVTVFDQLTTYYKFKGWNMDGIPTKERLVELDLGYVAEDLEKRGILKNGENKKED
jgi:aldehyde:ferredoxin oxidoreductase